MKQDVSLKKQSDAKNKPPSTVLKEFFSSMKKRGKNPTDADNESMSKQTLLPSSEVKMWLEHLEQVHLNRKRGAAKAAETRRIQSGGAKTARSSHTTIPAAEEYYCGHCGGKYEEETDEPEYWIGCDKCLYWFHGDCVGIQPEDEREEYFCCSCMNS